MAAKQKASGNLGVVLLGVYALLVWFILGDASLPFPLSEQDQHRVASALGFAWGLPHDSWVADTLDPWMARLLPQDPYPLLVLLRRFSGTLAMMGLVIWIWRSLGWVKGIWGAVLGISLLPLSWVAGTLSPQPFCLVLLIWGHLLVHGPPWTKTGMAEAFGGGIFLGAATFSAPWGWLFGLAVPIRTLWSKSYRAKLESGFWWGLGLGLLPGLIWWWSVKPDLDLGLHLETLSFMKITTIADLAFVGWGIPVVILAVLGLRSFLSPALLGPQDLIWPLGVSVILGYGDLASSSLGLPGVIFLAIAGLERIGGVFISRTEKALIPTFLVFGLGYLSFFSGHHQMRDQQYYSSQVERLARLVAEHIPEKSAVMLGRNNSILAYLNALSGEVNYFPLDENALNLHLQDLPEFLSEQGIQSSCLWIEPGRVSEAGYGALVDQLLGIYPVERIWGEGNIELIRVDLTDLR